MGHTPYGYKIENGKAVIDKGKAEKIKCLFSAYLSGMSLSATAKEAGINAYHSTVNRMLSNNHYLGDDFYPPIIENDIFNKVSEERQCRLEKHGKSNKAKAVKPYVIPTHFHFDAVSEHYESPKAQAEYLYSLIESEVD